MQRHRFCRPVLRAGTLSLACLLATGQAQAQTQPAAGVSSGPSQQLSERLPQVAPDVEHLFGDWGGVRTSLGERGIYPLFDAITELAGNVRGGVKQGATFANQVAAELDIDWQRLARVPGLSTHIVIVNRSGSNDSTLFGDNLLPVQEIYGSGGDTAIHLVYAYAEERLLGGMLDVAVGRMPLANDFAASPLYCSFMNNSLCGNPKSLPGGDIGFSSYPDAVWGGRARVRPRPDTYVQFGVYEVNQGLYSFDNFRSGFKFDGSRDSGVMLPVEVAWEPTFGRAKLPGHYKLGFAYDTSDIKDFAAAPPLSSATAEVRHGNTQVWALADQMLLRHGPGDAEGLMAVAGFIHNDPNNSVYAEQYFAGLIDQGFWRARPQDSVGLLFSYNTVSGRLGKLQASEDALGLAFSNFATGVQTHEMILEANYNVHVFRGVGFQPDFQYIFRPNAQSNIRDAAVFGFKGHVTF